jgi:hypothetical protein
MSRIRAREHLELFDLMRTAVNGTEETAHEWYEAKRAVADGRDATDVDEPAIVIASEEDAAKFLRSIGR